MYDHWEYFVLLNDNLFYWVLQKCLFYLLFFMVMLGWLRNSLVAVFSWCVNNVGYFFIVSIFDGFSLKEITEFRFHWNYLILEFLYIYIYIYIYMKLHKNVASNIEQVLAATPPQVTNYTATCLPPRKLSKLDEPDMQDTAGEARTSS